MCVMSTQRDWRMISINLYYAVLVIILHNYLVQGGQHRDVEADVNM